MWQTLCLLLAAVVGALGTWLVIRQRDRCAERSWLAGTEERMRYRREEVRAAEARERTETEGKTSEQVIDDVDRMLDAHRGIDGEQQTGMESTGRWCRKPPGPTGHIPP